MSIADNIASADRSVDEKWGMVHLTPLSRLNGQSPMEYYHFAGRVDAETRLARAIADRDETAFGEALHTYQDYHCHLLRGYSYHSGDAGVTELYEKCPDCSEWTSEQRRIGERHARNCTGHFLCSTDTFSPLDDPTDIAMVAGTEYWILAFLLVRMSVDFEEWADYGIDPALYLERIGQLSSESSGAAPGATIRLQ